MNFTKKSVMGTIGLAVIIAAATVVFTGFTMISQAVCELNGFSTTQFSVFFSLYTAGNTLSIFILSKLIEKIGMKKLAFVSAIAPLLGCAALIWCKNIYILWIAGFFVGAFLGVSAFPSFNIFVSSWFNRGRGKMMTLNTIILSICSLGASPAIAGAVTEFGVVKATIGLGIVLTLIALIGAFCVCNLPGAYGAKPVDIGKEEAPKADAADVKAATPQEAVYDVQMPARRLLKFPAVLMCELAPTIACLANTMYYIYIIYVFQSFGLDYMTASLFVSIVFASALVLTPIIGILCDKIGAKRTIVLFALIAAASRAIPAFTGGIVGAVIFAAFGGATSFATMYSGLVTPQIVGQKATPALIGWSGAILGVGSIFAAPLAMALVNADGGSYNLLLIVCGVMFAVSALMTMAAMSKKAIEQIKKADEEYLAAEAAKQSA